MSPVLQTTTYWSPVQIMWKPLRFTSASSASWPPFL